MTLPPTFSVSPVDRRLQAELQQKIDTKTKPLGALGKLENLALKIGLIQQALQPTLNRPVILVFAGDHGIVAEGVSPFPQAVTQQMVLNFLTGGAAINVFSRQHEIVLRVVDAGVAADFPPHPQLVNAKVAYGSANFLKQPALTQAQCASALNKGAELARVELAAGSNVLGFGEMGIGNTTSAAALMSVLCRLPVSLCAGRGTGLNDAGLTHKISVIEQAIAFHKVNAASPFEVLSTFGGLEIAMMTGAMLAAAEARAVLLVDGFIASAALLVAARMQPAVLDYCVFSHRSGEAGHLRLLEKLNADPLLDLGMRLGEGTGCAVVWPLLQSAVAFLNEMASFESAGVSNKSA